jgi:hypothetical protein
MRARRVAIAALVGALTGCGATTAPGGTPTRATTATPQPVVSATATPSPPPSPPPPLAVLGTDGGGLSAVDVTGHVQWGLSGAAVSRLLSATSNDTITARTAGPNLILSTIPAASPGAGVLVVLDRTGAKIGGGSFTPNGVDDDVHGSPTGTEWAWSVVDSAIGAEPAHGRIMVAGIGVAAHTVFSWVAPAGSFDERVGGWTDMGIVMERISVGGCGLGFHGDTASFLVDPVAQTLTNLFTNGDHYADARRGVRAGYAGQSQSAVVVNDVTYDEPSTVANDVYVSPDGAHVGVQRYAIGGCSGGPPEPSLNTEMIDVATGSHTDLTGCGISGWLDARDVVCHPLNDLTERLVSLDGRTLATLGTGVFDGALPGD